MGQLDGLVVVVTGGNGGIGLGMARAMGRAGAAIAVWGRNPEKNEASVAELKGLGVEAAAFECDVAEEAQVDGAMAATLSRFDKIDSMFANAGIGTALTPFAETTLADWRRVTSVNLDGVFLSFRAAVRHMVERGEGGSLVGISSTSALHGAPRNQAYASSKAAVLSMVRGLAVELARYGIRANSILPGWIETDMTAPGLAYEKFVTATTNRTPVRRWGRPDDHGPTAVYLADPRHQFHTGDMLVVDGGYTIF